MLYASLIILGGCLVFILVETVRAKNTGFETKTLWDWMELLVIPLVLAGGALFLQQSERSIDRKTAEDRVMLERELVTDRQQEAALQAYLDRMTELLLKENLRTTTNEEVRNVARMRTLTVLRGLDSKRKVIVVVFLFESGLIVQQASVDLSFCDLSLAELSETNLSKADLGGVDLSGAKLCFADLSEACLSEAYLSEADLSGANLSKADLSVAYLGEADLSEADLSGANLSGTDLSKAKISTDQLATAKSLKGATMPDGTIHE